MSTSTTKNRLDDDSLSATPRLATHEATPETSRVPNFVHVGENPYALEGYLRLYFRDWTERARSDSTH